VIYEVAKRREVPRDEFLRALDEDMHAMVLKDYAALPNLFRVKTMQSAEKLRAHPYVRAADRWDVQIQAARTVSLSNDGDFKADKANGNWGTTRAFRRHNPFINRTFSLAEAPFSATTTVNRTGSGVHLYVMDSGLETTQDWFTGTVTPLFSRFATDPNNPTLAECDETYGHGTWMTYCAAADDEGVAPGVEVLIVRALDSNGSLNTSDFVNAADAIVTHYNNTATGPGVVNMSLSFFNSPASTVVTATDDMVSAGLVCSASAGNEDADLSSNDVEPAETTGVLTVGATTIRDTIAGFSTYGTAVDIWSPGEEVACKGAANAWASISGTSPAAAFVAGVCALMLQGRTPFTTLAEVQSFNDELKANALTRVPTRGKYAGNTNKLLYFDPTTAI
jgi:hypothetical protein